MGLVDRVVPAGAARPAAEELARELAALPQPALRHDRLSVYEQEGLPLEAALRAEFRHGRQSQAEGALEGADASRRATAGTEARRAGTDVVSSAFCLRFEA